jgi:hypothetical protein
LLSTYAAAQVVDRRLELADTISTAVYFHESPSPAIPAAIREYQLQRAGQVSESVDVRQAVPYTMPRAAYVMAVLLLVAGSLFALRYGLLGRLDLQPPLAHMLQQQFGWQERTEVAKTNRRPPPKSPEQQDDAGASVNDPDQSQSMKPDSSISDGSDPSGEPNAEKGDASQGDNKKDGNRTGKSSADGDQEAQAETNPSQSGDDAKQDGGKQDAKQQSGSKPDANNQGENSSLMNKAKDMLQNLLSSMKPPQSNPGDQQKSNDPGKQQGKGDPKQQKDKNGQPQSGQKGDQSEGQQGEQGQDQQDQQQQSNGKNDSQQGTKQPGSGAGNQDGDKRIKAAADVAAMGKITEILGKRSATITGEATVEVQSTAQQLKTAYAPGAAQHGQSGGEINRDEIPMAMRPFVQEYFKQARKTAPATTPAAPAAAPAPATGAKKQ